MNDKDGDGLVKGASGQSICSYPSSSAAIKAKSAAASKLHKDDNKGGTNPLYQSRGEA